MASNGLTYTGNSRILPGAPPRNLTDDEVKKYGGYELLLSSGVYEEIKSKTAKKKSEVDNGDN